MQRVSLTVLIELLSACATRDAAPAGAAVPIDDSAETTPSQTAPTAGPEGAIWNGNAPMVVIVPESVRSVSIGASPLRGTKGLGLGWFRVPTAVWRAALVQDEKRPYRVAPVHIDGKLAGEIWFAEGE